jgi:hypothetical protein
VDKAARIGQQSRMGGVLGERMRVVAARPGTCELHGTRPGTSNIYDEVADPVVWPTPQTSTTAEDVEILKDRQSNWDSECIHECLVFYSLPFQSQLACSNTHTHTHTHTQTLTQTGPRPIC